MSFLKDLRTEFYNESSFLKVEAIVAWKKKKRHYNFDLLPSTAVIVLNKKILASFSSPFKKKLKGLPGTGYALNTSVLLCSMQGSGAPGALVLAEELRVLGVKNIIFIGTAGLIDSTVSEGQAFLISKAYSTVGSSFFYSEETLLEPRPGRFFEEIKQGLHLTEGSSWSTDCPYRETPSLIEEHRSKEVQLVDMESAAIYAFCNFYKLNSACILIAADSLTQDQWQPPKKHNLLQERQIQLISKLTSLISLHK